MSGSRQPVRLLQLKGTKHLTKAEIAEREASEVAPHVGRNTPPTYLTQKQKRRFRTVYADLERLGIIGETDLEALARYVVAESEYETSCELIEKIRGTEPNRDDFLEYGAFAEARGRWLGNLETADKRQDRYFRQAHTAASALGLTITARCKLVAPKVEEPPKNKFSAFLPDEKEG